MAKPENPPAFPRTMPSWLDEQNGMSLRDYFAGQALVGWISSNGVARIIEQYHESVAGALIVMAAGCYQAADAMLKAREPQKDPAT